MPEHLPTSESLPYFWRLGVSIRRQPTCLPVHGYTDDCGLFAAFPTSGRGVTAAGVGRPFRGDMTGRGGRALRGAAPFAHPVGGWRSIAAAPWWSYSRQGQVGSDPGALKAETELVLCATRPLDVALCAPRPEFVVPGCHGDSIASGWPGDE